MITLITGAPGSGKTAALVSLLQELGKNRAIYCDGIPDLKLDHVELPEPTKWHESVPDGSIIVIDEVQRVWRPRGPGAKVPPDIAALETHRHRGLDFYVITQAPRLVDTNVRALVGRHIHLREMGVLGRWWYEWPECAEQCISSWKQAPIKKRYKLPKAIFGSYKSASEHIKPVRSVPWMLAVMVLAIIITLSMAWKTYTMIQSKMAPASPSEPSPSKPSIGDITARAQSQAASMPSAPEYDFAQFFPRVSSKPETAPAYDHLRQVVNMPLITGAVCTKTCKCYTQQGTDAGLSSDECRAWLNAPSFDPYTPSVSASRASPRGTHPGYGLQATPETPVVQAMPTATAFPAPQAVQRIDHSQQDASAWAYMASIGKPAGPPDRYSTVITEIR